MAVKLTGLKLCSTAPVTLFNGTKTRFEYLSNAYFMQTIDILKKSAPHTNLSKIISKSAKK